jgi:hypothetical protein
MKKRLLTRVMFRIPNSHLHASALLERQTVPISIQLYLQNNSGRYQKAKQKEEVISFRPAPLARWPAALRRPSPLRYLGSDTIVRSPYATNLTSHRKSWAPCAHHGHME